MYVTIELPVRVLGLVRNKYAVKETRSTNRTHTTATVHLSVLTFRTESSSTARGCRVPREIRPSCTNIRVTCMYCNFYCYWLQKRGDYAAYTSIYGQCQWLWQCLNKSLKKKINNNINSERLQCRGIFITFPLCITIHE